MRKLHMGTVSYGFDSMDEVAHQLAVAFGASAEQGVRVHTSYRPIAHDLGTQAHKRIGSTTTGAQLATRGRRDMSSRVHDAVLSLALCHNVRGQRPQYKTDLT